MLQKLFVIRAAPGHAEELTTSPHWIWSGTSETRKGRKEEGVERGMEGKQGKVSRCHTGTFSQFQPWCEQPAQSHSMTVEQLGIEHVTS